MSAISDKYQALKETKTKTNKTEKRNELKQFNKPPTSSKKNNSNMNKIATIEKILLPKTRQSMWKNTLSRSGSKQARIKANKKLPSVGI